MKYFVRISFFLFFCMETFMQSVFATPAEKTDTINSFFFIKRENTSGVVFDGKSEREELLTDFSREKEELFSGAAKYRLNSRSWNFLDYKQEKIEFNIEAGLLTGFGDWLDSARMQVIEADHKIIGLRTGATANYSSRFYYDHKNYTLVKVNAWGRYDLFQRNSEGTILDSNRVSSEYDKNEIADKFRYGLRAKAGWGVGRLNPVNHFMVAEYFLDNYYNKRVFSESETMQLAYEIGRIKHSRDFRTNRLPKKEVLQLKEYLKTEMMLRDPGNIEEDWQLGEFLPRFDGNRFEFGPFFNYYSQEPDFIYGAFVQYDNAHYINYKQNRNFSVNLGYNRYKAKDWLLMEADLGWAFYSNLKTKVNIGVKYVPGTVVHSLDNFEPVNHNLIPYFEYYSQMNSSTRVTLTFAWKITDGEQFMQPGPEFSLSIYRSRY